MGISQYDVAKAAGVSQRAVSFALNGKPNVSKEKRAKIIEVAKKMGYRPSATARAMQRRSTGAIGVLVQHYNSEEAMLEGINRTLQKAGYCTMIEQYGGVLKLNPDQSRLLLERVVDGLIIINADESVTDLVHSQFASLASQMVWLESAYFGADGCIRRDEAAVAEHAVKHLASLGYDRILYVERHAGLTHGKEQMPYNGGIHHSCAHRRDAVKSTCEQLGLDCSAIDSQLRLTPLTSQQLAAQLDLKRGDRVALLGYDFWVCEWANRRLLEIGLHCPKDYGLLSLDEPRQFNTANIWPELSRYSFDRMHLGQQSAQMLLGMLEHKTPMPSELFGPQLFAGQTL